MKRELNKTKLCAVGGFIVGTTALMRTLAIPDGNHPAQKQIQLRRADQDSTSIDNDKGIETDPDTNQKGSYTSIDKGKDIETDPGTISEGLYEWADIEGYSIEMNRSLQSANEQSRAIVPAGPSVSRRTNLFDSSNPNDDDDKSFRLKLFWKKGYYWQESRKETWWCMSCGNNGNCVENEQIKLVNCKKKTDDDARFKLVEQRRGVQYQVAGTNLCLEKRGGARIRLKQCRNSRRQLFLGYRDGKEFDIIPFLSKRRCLTNHHHPKRGEVIYAETCKKAHRTRTGYWVKY